MIGGHAAQMLSQSGHEVVLGSRNPARAGTPMALFPTLIGDYSPGRLSAQLEGFDAVVFAAGNDIRHLPKDADEGEFWRVMQIEGVPDFVRRAKQAGVGRVVQLGSYYHQVMPHLAEIAYVRARKLADEGARALADDHFNVSTLNPPSIVGALPGMPAKRYETLVAWARGDRPDIPDYAPAGGTNYMSVKSLSEAIAGALQNASPAAPISSVTRTLVPRVLPAHIRRRGEHPPRGGAGEEHPLLPDAFIVPGRGKVLAYEPDPAETALLGYTRNDVERAVREVVATVGAPQ